MAFRPSTLTTLTASYPPFTLITNSQPPTVTPPPRAHKVLSDARTRRDYDEGGDVLLPGRDEVGGLREQVTIVPRHTRHAYVTATIASR